MNAGRSKNQNQELVMNDPRLAIKTQLDDNKTPVLSLRDVAVSYDSVRVVQDINLQFYPGEISCLLGPSGCGKSTILRSIAGFEPLVTGEIWLNGRQLSSQHMHVSPEERRIGMVFQDLALFPHKTVADNIGFGLRQWSRTDRQARIQQLLSLIELEGFENRYPHSLSGGQQQRVALARAIAPKPTFLLLDEPFSSLDVEMREELVPQVREILIKEQIAGLLVTHDQLEAFAMADRIAVLRAGRVEQFDTGYYLYHEPKSRFVADFIGQGEFLRARVEDNYSVDSPLGTLIGKEPHGFALGDEVEVLIRPDDVLHDDDSEFKAIIVSKRFRGSHFLYRVSLAADCQLYCFAPSHHNHQIGEPIGIRVSMDHLVMYPVNARANPVSQTTDVVDYEAP